MFIVGPLLSRPTMNRSADDSRPVFTPKQGQYLAFIHAYTLVNGRPPAEADMMRFFRVTPPTVHQMVLTLEQAGLISRQPGVARGIAVLISWLRVSGTAEMPQIDQSVRHQLHTVV